MSSLRALSDSELIERLPALVKSERHAMVEVIEHLVEVERRRLYLRVSSTTSLHGYCIKVLGYSEDAALNRHRVAQLALRVPQVLDELRAGSMHLTGLFLLSKHLTQDNASSLLGEARGKSRKQLDQLIARWFPRADVPARLEPLLSAGSPPTDVTCTDTGTRGRLEPLSPSRVRVEFTARAELYDKLERARELLSHAIPGGDLGELFERALDALLERETKKRFGAGKPRKARELKPGSRHVPVGIERAVWERDDAQCTFVDSEGRRCVERRFLTIEHRTPFALGGPPTLENLCLLCSAHNLESARHVFGAAHIEARIGETTGAGRTDQNETVAEMRPPFEVPARVLSSLRSLGFPSREASAAVGCALAAEPGFDVERLLRRCLLLLVPKAS